MKTCLISKPPFTKPPFVNSRCFGALEALVLPRVSAKNGLRPQPTKGPRAYRLDKRFPLIQRGTEVPLRRSALSVCPGGDPWGTLLSLEIRYARAPVKPPRGQTLGSPRPKVTSVLTRLALVLPRVGAAGGQTSVRRWDVCLLVGGSYLASGTYSSVHVLVSACLVPSVRWLEVCHRRCAMAGVGFSMISLG